MADFRARLETVSPNNAEQLDSLGGAFVEFEATLVRHAARIADVRAIAKSALLDLCNSDMPLDEKAAWWAAFRDRGGSSEPLTGLESFALRAQHYHTRLTEAHEILQPPATPFLVFTTRKQQNYDKLDEYTYRLNAGGGLVIDEAKGSVDEVKGYFIGTPETPVIPPHRFRINDYTTPVIKGKTADTFLNGVVGAEKAVHELRLGKGRTLSEPLIILGAAAINDFFAVGYNNTNNTRPLDALLGHVTSLGFKAEF